MIVAISNRDGKFESIKKVDNKFKELMKDKHDIQLATELKELFPNKIIEYRTLFGKWFVIS